MKRGMKHGCAASGLCTIQLEVPNAYLKQTTIDHLAYLFDMLMLKLDSEDQIRKLQWNW